MMWRPNRTPSAFFRKNASDSIIWLSKLFQFPTMPCMALLLAEDQCTWNQSSDDWWGTPKAHFSKVWASKPHKFTSPNGCFRWTKHNCGLRERPWRTQSPSAFGSRFQGLCSHRCCSVCQHQDSASVIHYSRHSVTRSRALQRFVAGCTWVICPQLHLHFAPQEAVSLVSCVMWNFMGAEQDWTSGIYFVWVWMAQFHGHLWCLRSMMIAESIMPMWHSGMRNRPKTPTTQLQSLRSEMVGHFVATPSW